VYFSTLKLTEDLEEETIGIVVVKQWNREGDSLGEGGGSTTPLVNQLGRNNAKFDLPATADEEQSWAQTMKKVSDNSLRHYR
jgi:hypothetical protein